MRMHTELLIYFMQVAVALPDTTDELMHVHALLLELLRLRAPRSLLVSVGRISKRNFTVRPPSRKTRNVRIRSQCGP